jgi:trk system potassium uptake protein TrkA
MKYLIVGLGNFGASLAQKLTNQGNEVIGVDQDMHVIEALKTTMSHAICLNAADEFAVKGLPLKNTDVVIVAIGKNQGANVMITALFKNLKVKRLISRAIDRLHENVLQAIGVDDIVHPEEETAERWAKKLCLKGVIDSFELNSDYSIVETSVPQSLIGKTIEEIKFRTKYNLLVLTTIKENKVNSLLGKSKTILDVQGVATPDLQFEKGDIIVLYGANSDIAYFLKKK